MKPATSEYHLHPPGSGLELDPFYSGLELDRNASGLEPVLVEYGPESTPAECLEESAPQVLIGTEEKEFIEGESPAGVTIQEPSRDLSRKKSWHRLAVTLILFLVLIAIVIPVSVTQIRNSSR